MRCFSFHQPAKPQHPLPHPTSALLHPPHLHIDAAVAAETQVREIQASGLLLLGWAAKGKAESEGASGGDSLPEDLAEQCLNVVATAEKLHSMDVAIKSHAGWARSYLQQVESRRKGTGAIVKRRAPSSEEDAWAGTSSLADEGGGING